MSSAPSRTLAELLAAAERRKYEMIRVKLGIPESLKIEGLQLESLNYQLNERSGPIQVILEGTALRVGEPGSSGGLVYYGDAVTFILKFWNISRDEARVGLQFEVQKGVRRIK